jgi:hypothetical protein
LAGPQVSDYDENVDPEDYPEPEWYWIDSDERASQADAEEYPDAVYDARDPEWADILDADQDAPADDDYDYAPDHPGDYDPGDYDDYSWVDDGDYYEVEIGIDYSPTGE